MFDVGIWEIGVIGVVALVVLGPERLPKVARTAGHMFGRLQRYVANVKADINREMEASEFSKLKEEVQSAAKTFETSVRDHASSVESEARALEKDATPALGNGSSADAGTKSQADLLAEQEAGLPSLDPSPATPTTPTTPTTSTTEPSRPVNTVAPSVDNPQAATSTYSPVVSSEQRFDLGIEPPRALGRNR
jgi:sec-independent protein translocase protein TatB